MLLAKSYRVAATLTLPPESLPRPSMKPLNSALFPKAPAALDNVWIKLPTDSAVAAVAVLNACMPRRPSYKELPSDPDAFCKLYNESDADLDAADCARCTADSSLEESAALDVSLEYRSNSELSLLRFAVTAFTSSFKSAMYFTPISSVYL